MVDIYQTCARMFATWFRIKLIMGFIIIVGIINMSLSSWQTESDGGDFAGIKSDNTSANGTTIADYSSWKTSICASSPYIYVEPFAFTYQYDGVDYSNTAYCGYPRNNSVLRIFSSVITIIILGALFFETPLSALGRTFQMILACLCFTSFVLDANAVSTGLATCDTNFANTHLYDDISKLKLTLKCLPQSYAVVAIINFLMTALLLLLQAAWSNCTDMYSGVPKAPTNV
jgi:hypothetical protein